MNFIGNFIKKTFSFCLQARNYYYNSGEKCNGDGIFFVGRENVLKEIVVVNRKKYRMQHRLVNHRPTAESIWPIVVVNGHLGIGKSEIGKRMMSFPFLSQFVQTLHVEENANNTNNNTFSNTDNSKKDEFVELFKRKDSFLYMNIDLSGKELGFNNKIDTIINASHRMAIRALAVACESSLSDLLIPEKRLAILHNLHKNGYKNLSSLLKRVGFVNEETTTTKSIGESIITSITNIPSLKSVLTALVNDHRKIKKFDASDNEIVIIANIDDHHLMFDAIKNHFAISYNSAIEEHKNFLKEWMVETQGIEYTTWCKRKNVFVIPTFFGASLNCIDKISLPQHFTKKIIQLQPLSLPHAMTLFNYHHQQQQQIHKHHSVKIHKSWLMEPTAPLQIFFKEGLCLPLFVQSIPRSHAIIHLLSKPYNDSLFRELLSSAKNVQPFHNVNIQIISESQAQAANKSSGSIADIKFDPKREEEDDVLVHEDYTKNLSKTALYAALAGVDFEPSMMIALKVDSIDSFSILRTVSKTGRNVFKLSIAPALLSTNSISANLPPHMKQLIQMTYKNDLEDIWKKMYCERVRMILHIQSVLMKERRVISNGFLTSIVLFGRNCKIIHSDGNHDAIINNGSEHNSVDTKQKWKWLSQGHLHTVIDNKSNSNDDNNKDDDDDDDDTGIVSFDEEEVSNESAKSTIFNNLFFANVFNRKSSKRSDPSLSWVAKLKKDGMIMISNQSKRHSMCDLLIHLRGRSRQSNDKYFYWVSFKSDANHVNINQDLSHLHHLRRYECIGRGTFNIHHSLVYVFTAQQSTDQLTEWKKSISKFNNSKNNNDVAVIIADDMNDYLPLLAHRFNHLHPSPSHPITPVTSDDD